jgi:hypothetical protein
MIQQITHSNRVQWVADAGNSQEQPSGERVNNTAARIRALLSRCQASNLQRMSARLRIPVDHLVSVVDRLCAEGTVEELRPVVPARADGRQLSASVHVDPRVHYRLCRASDGDFAWQHSVGGDTRGFKRLFALECDLTRGQEGASTVSPK